MTRALSLGLCFATWAAVASAQTSATPARRAPVRPAAPGATALPGTPESAFAVIQGNVLDSTSSVMPGALVRLRDARLGRIVNTQLTDRAGLFQFRGVDPGSYIVELLAKDTVLAACQLISVNAGEAISADAKQP